MSDRKQGGYFKVSMAAAQWLAGQRDGDVLLAAWLVLCKHAYGKQRELTAAGAKAIGLVLGVTDHRSKRLLDKLQTLCDPQTGEPLLLEPVGRMLGNAQVRRILPWPGEYSYLPSLLLEAGEAGSHILRQLLHRRIPAQARADVLLVVLHAYAVVDMAQWFGCPPDRFVASRWLTGGDHEPTRMPLGCCQDDDEPGLWLVEDTGSIGRQPLGAWVETLFGGVPHEQACRRFHDAFSMCADLSLFVPVAVVEDDIEGERECYLLWVHLQHLRQRWAQEHGLICDLARIFGNVAVKTDDDVNATVMDYAVNDCAGAGSGLYFCLASKPTVWQLYVPRLWAPTARNMQGVQEMVWITARLKERLYTEVF